MATESMPTLPAPQACGYVRAETADEATIARWRLVLGEYCRAKGWRLVLVGCDRGSDGSEYARPGLAAVLEAVRRRDTVALIVPELEHVSPDPAIRTAVTNQVRQSGAEVVVAQATDGQSGCTDEGRSA